MGMAVYVTQSVVAVHPGDFLVLVCWFLFILVCTVSMISDQKCIRLYD